MPLEEAGGEVVVWAVGGGARFAVKQIHTINLINSVFWRKPQRISVLHPASDAILLAKGPAL